MGLVNLNFNSKHFTRPANIRWRPVSGHLWDLPLDFQKLQLVPGGRAEVHRGSSHNLSHFRESQLGAE